MSTLRTTSINKDIKQEIDHIATLKGRSSVIIYEVRVHQFIYKEEKIICEEKGQKTCYVFLLLSGLL
jgi:predicted transcriptional regulator